MAQTKSIQEQLAAVHEQLQSALKQRDEDVKTRVAAAMAHAREASAELKTRIDRSNAHAGEQYKEALSHLDDVLKQGKKAMDEAGTSLQKRVSSMAESATSAIASAQKASK